MIEIKIEMDESGNIVLSAKDRNDYVISFENKTINAQKIYDFLNYSNNSKYTINTNIDNIEDKKLKNYFKDVIDLFEEIICDINKMYNAEAVENVEDNKIGIDDILSSF